MIFIYIPLQFIELPEFILKFKHKPYFIRINPASQILMSDMFAKRGFFLPVKAYLTCHNNKKSNNLIITNDTTVLKLGNAYAKRKEKGKEKK